MGKQTRHGKFNLNKTNRSGSIQFLGGGFIAQISTLGLGVSKKDTRSGARVQFMSRVRTKPRVAKTTKDSQFEVIWRRSKELVIGRGHVQGRSRQTIDKVGGDEKSIKPEEER